MNDQYYVEMNGEDRGPFTLNQLRAMWNSGKLTGDILFAQPGMKEWRKLSTIIHLLEPAPTPSPPLGDRDQHYSQQSRPIIVRTAKSRGTYIILGLLFGWLGIHNFYAGRNGVGAFQLVLTLLLGWVFIGILISGLIALVEIITVDTDGDGERMV